MQEAQHFTTKVVRLNNSLYRLGSLGEPPVLSSYLIVDKNIAIVDCGPRSVIEELLNLVAECGVSPSQIDSLLLTHIHLDHAGGAGKFLEKCSSARVYVPERGFKHLLNPDVLNASSRSVLGERIFNSWGSCEALPETRTFAVKPHEKIDLGNTELEYIPATGHAPHHNVLLEEKESIVFSADALGIYDKGTSSIIPTTPPPSFDLEQAIKDIDMIKDWNLKMACMAHFSEISPDENYFELLKNRFIVWAEIISNHVREKDLGEYQLDDCFDLFSRLAKKWPEYENLSAEMKEQVSKVDVGGMLNYFIRKLEPRSRTR